MPEPSQKKELLEKSGEQQRWTEVEAACPPDNSQMR